MSVMMDCYGLTDVGKHRANNEDQFLIADLDRLVRVRRSSLGSDGNAMFLGDRQGKLLAVADGMGGCAAGNRASFLAIRTAATYFLSGMPWIRLHEEADEELLCQHFIETMARCRRRLRNEALKAGHERGMGTTLTLAYIAWPKLFVAHVGDSRCYVLRDRELKQVTTDHTVAQKLIEESPGMRGQIDNRWHHTLWNVIGSHSKDFAPDIHRIGMEMGDTVLLCSDGLTKHLDDARIGEILAKNLPADETSRRLIEAANEAGGSDNITAVVVRVDSVNARDDFEPTAAPFQAVYSDDTENDSAGFQTIAEGMYVGSSYSHNDYPTPFDA